MDRTRLPFAMGWTSCAREILSAGRKTMDGMFAAAQYAESAAEVSPVEAHPTAESVLRPFLRMRFTCDTSTVIPRSLKEPVCELPHCLTHRSDIPSTSFPKRSAQKRLELPSNMETMSSSSMPGRIHSFLLHTPLPVGHAVFPTRSSKRAFQYSGP